MPIETTLLALPVTDLVIIGAVAAFCCILGWQARRFATRGHEAALKRSLFEAKGAVPQLETAVRHREQQVNTLAGEIKSLKDRLSEFEASMRQKESEIAKRDREIRTLNSELTIVKDGTSSGQVLLDGEEAAVEPASADPELAKRHAALEARYEALKRGMIQRDDRIAELEDALKNPGTGVPTRTLEHELSELERTSAALKTTLEEREQQLEVLQTRLQEEVAQREALEDLAKRRSEGNRELKAAAARYEEQIPSLMKTIKSRTHQVAERDGKLLSLTRALKEEQQQREARETDVAKQQEQLAAMASRHHDLQQRQQEQDEAQRALQAELTSKTNALRATEAVVREREAAIADAERRVAAANERSRAGERTLTALQHTIKDRDFKIESLEAEANQQSAKLEMLRATFFEAKASHNEHIAELNARHDKQCKAVHDLSAEHNRLYEEATAQKAHVAQLEQQLSQRDDTLAALETEQRRRAEQLEAARGELDTLRVELADLTDALARSTSALRQRRCAIMLLVARTGSPTLLLPAPAAKESPATGVNTAVTRIHPEQLPTAIAATP